MDMFWTHSFRNNILPTFAVAGGQERSMFSPWLHDGHGPYVLKLVGNKLSSFDDDIAK